MKKTVFVAAMVSLLGLTSIGYANEDDDAPMLFPGCGGCDPSVIDKAGEWVTVARFWKKCQRSGDYCGGRARCSTSTFSEEGETEIIKSILRASKGRYLFMKENKNIALAVADVNPWAAESFALMYALSQDENRNILENSEFMGMDFVSPSSFTAGNAKKIINAYHEGLDFSPDEMADIKKGGREKIRTVHEVTKTADDGAWLNIRISTVDSEYKETGRILPDVRIKLRRVENAEGGYWEPIDWEY